MALDPRELHLDTFLTNILIGYKPTGLIGDQIFPVIPVDKRTNVYAQIDRGNWFRIPSTLRAEGTLPKEVAYTVSSGTYVCANYELATSVPYETMDNADAPHRPMATAGELLIDQLMLDFENRVYNRVISNVGSSLVRAPGSNAAWDDFGNSDPISDMELGSEAMRRGTGYEPNLMILGYRSWLKIRRHPDVIRAVSPLGGAGVGGMVTPEQFASIIGINKVLVAKPIKNTAEEGQANVFTDVWSTHCVMAYVADRPGLMVPTYGYCFRWTGENIGANGPRNFGMFTERDDKRKVQYLQTGYYQDERIVAPELGFLIQTGIQ